LESSGKLFVPEDDLMTTTIGETTQVAHLSSLNVRPAIDEEWVIHNIYIPIGSTVEIYRWNDIGTTPEILITKVSNSMLFQSFHCTLDEFIIVKNISGASIYISYDGVVM
jgi:hypothetical protein